MEDESLRTVYVTINPFQLERGESFRDASRRLGLEKANSTPGLLDEVPWLDVSSSTEMGFVDAGRLHQSHGGLCFLNDDDSSPGKKAKKETSKKKRQNQLLDSPPKDSKKTEQNNRKKQVKLEMFKLLNAAAGGEKLNSIKLLRLMNEEPACTKSKYLLSSFPEPVRPLHFLSAFNAPLECIQKCYKLNPDALRDSSSSSGTPFHLACNGKVAIKVSRYFASQDADSLLLLNHAKRTPLHMAVLSNADSELVALLTEACPKAAELKDLTGSTPLDLAVSAKEPDIDVIEDLISVYPDAICQGALHSAIANIALSADILKMLMLKRPKCLKYVDDDGNTPFHFAALHKRSYKEIKVMARKYPKGLHKLNGEGETAHKIAKRLGLDSEIISLLRPNDRDLV